MWNSSQELLETIHDAHERLRRNETDAITAHAEARLLGAATRVLAIGLEHARLTGRLKEGMDSLPIMIIDSAGDGLSPAIDVTASRPQIASETPSS
jgi:hypothetical protein